MLHTKYIKPKVQVIYSNKEEAQFILSPIEKGFGISFANILRRVILRYTPGAGVIGLRVRGVDYLHPHTKIPGVKEDVTEMLSNLRNLLIKTEENNSFIMGIEQKGPCILKAEHISHDDNVYIMNHDQYICTLDSEAQVSFVLYGNTGYGYVPSPYHGTKKDVVYSDTIYNPVRHVSYHLRAYATYDEIIFNLTTNGTCYPCDVMNNAFSFLRAKMDITMTSEEHPN